MESRFGADWLAQKLDSLDACGPARTWSAGRSLEEAWRDCVRGDWMVWFAVEVGVDRRLIVHSLADCVEQTLPFVAGDNSLAAAAIAAARACADNPCKKTRRATYVAARAAYAAAREAYAVAGAAARVAVAVARAAYAAAREAYAVAVAAARVAVAVARAADAVGLAAYAVARAADATARAAAEAAYAENLKQSADLIRVRIPFAVIAAALSES